METLQLLEAVGQIANGIGATALAISITVLFIRGDIISKAVLDRILAIYEKQMQEALKVFTERLDTALERQTGIFSDKMQQLLDRAWSRNNSNKEG